MIKGTFICALLSMACSAADYGSEWTGTCKTGKMQSPVALSAKDATKSSLMEVIGYNYFDFPLTPASDYTAALDWIYSLPVMSDFVGQEDKEISAKKNRTRLTIKYPMMVDSGESGEADADEMTDEMGDDDMDDMDDMEEGTEEMDDTEEGTDDMDDMEDGTDDMDDAGDMGNADEMNDMDEMEDEMDDNDVVDEEDFNERRLEDEDEKAKEETIDGVKYMQAMADYIPVSFKLLSPSEHTVDGLTYDLELQFLHEHATNSGEIAIISVFFDREHGGTEENKFLKSLVDADTDMPDWDNNEDWNLGDEYDGPKVAMEEFLDNINWGKYWSYEGSLTTYPCTEGVKYIVVKHVETLSEGQHEQYTITDYVEDEDGNWQEVESGNARPVQELGDRTVFSNSGAIQMITGLVSIASMTALALF